MKTFDDRDKLREYVNERVRELAAIHGPAFQWRLSDWTMEPAPDSPDGLSVIVRVPCCGEVIEARLDLLKYLPAGSREVH
jgi:hypothetical protein